MENQVIELLHIINKKIDTLSNDNKVFNNKIHNVIDRINDLEKDINSNTSISSKNDEFLTVNELMKIYKISKEKIYKDIKSKEFTSKYSQRKRSGKILIKKNDWDLWFSGYVVPDLLSDIRKEDIIKKSKKKKKKSDKKKVLKSKKSKKKIIPPFKKLEIN